MHSVGFAVFIYLKIFKDLFFYLIFITMIAQGSGFFSVLLLLFIAGFILVIAGKNAQNDFYHLEFVKTCFMTI